MSGATEKRLPGERRWLLAPCLWCGDPLWFRLMHRACEASIFLALEAEHGTAILLRSRLDEAKANLRATEATRDRALGMLEAVPKFLRPGRDAEGNLRHRIQGFLDLHGARKPTLEVAP